MGLLDAIGSRHDKIDVHLQGDDYQNIELLEGSQMLGYFSQTMQNLGFPWRFYEAVPDGKGRYKKGEAMSDIDALKALRTNTQAGEVKKPVLFQPMRKLRLDLSSTSLGALAATASLGGTNAATMARVAAVSKDTGITPGSQGWELKYGEPIVVCDMGELKLLHQMYNPTDEIKAKTPVGKAAQQFSYFTRKTAGSTYPWRFYVKDDTNVAWRVTKALVKNGVTGALVGAAVGAVLGGPFAYFSGNWAILQGFATTGAMVGGAYNGIDSARKAVKGRPINPVEALERVLNNQEVAFQEAHLHSWSVPILSSMTWMSDHGPASKISSSEELDVFYYMQNQDAKLPKKEEKKKEPDPEPPRVVIFDQRSFHTHHHLGSESHLHQGEEIHEHPRTIIVT